MIHFKGFILEKQQCENHKNDQGDDFPQNFQLNQGIRSSIFIETDPVCGYLEEIFEKGDSPADHHNGDQPKIFKPFQLLEFQMPVPCKCHEGIRQNQQRDGIKTFHFSITSGLNVGIEAVIILNKS